MLYKVSGYFKDIKANFENYYVYSYHNKPPFLNDDDIFYYGLNEKDLEDSCEEDGLDFVITKFEKVNLVDLLSQDKVDEILKDFSTTLEYLKIDIDNGNLDEEACDLETYKEKIKKYLTEDE